MIVKITKLSDNENAWVDSTGIKEGLVGYVNMLPQIGHELTLFHEREKDQHMMRLTELQNIQLVGERKYLLTTKNSVYLMENVTKVSTSLESREEQKIPL